MGLRLFADEFGPDLFDEVIRDPSYFVVATYTYDDGGFAELTEHETSDDAQYYLDELREQYNKDVDERHAKNFAAYLVKGVALQVDSKFEENDEQ